MGGAESKTTCSHPIDPDILSVITLSDSAVQRLPLQTDDKPLEKELRNQNIDGFWRDRIDCMEQAFAESKQLTEKEFRRLEFEIKKMSPGAGKLVCPRVVEDTLSCYLAYPSEPLNCTPMVQKLEKCLDTSMQESLRKRHEDFKKREKQKRC